MWCHAEFHKYFKCHWPDSLPYRFRGFLVLLWSGNSDLGTLPQILSAHLCVIILHIFYSSLWPKIPCDMGQLTARKHMLRNNVHEQNHNLLVIHVCLTYLAFIFSFSESLLAFFLHFQFPLLCGFRSFGFSPWILCHSYFPYILHLSILSAGVLVQKIDTLIAVNYHTLIHTCPQCCLWCIAKALLHISP